MQILRITNREAIPRVDVEAHPLDDKCSSVVPTVWDHEEIKMYSLIIRPLNLGLVTTADHNSERDVLIVKRSRSRSKTFRLKLNNTSETMSCSRGFRREKECATIAFVQSGLQEESLDCAVDCWLFLWNASSSCGMCKTKCLRHELYFDKVLV